MVDRPAYPPNPARYYGNKGDNHSSLCNLMLFLRTERCVCLCSDQLQAWRLEQLGLIKSKMKPSSISLSLLRSVLLLLKNPTFLFLCLAGATEATLIAGMSTFGPKFLESQFSLSASEAATWFGETQRHMADRCGWL